MPYDPLDFAALLAPISEAEPAGNSSIFEILDKLRSERKTIIQIMAEDPTPREGDWNRIVNLATDTLQSTSKHLQVAVRLVEALARRDGYTGLRDGLRFLRQMCEQCWDRMYPELDPSDPTVRSDPFEYLNDTNAGALMPIMIKSLPMVFSEDGQFSWADINAKAPAGAEKKVLDDFAEREKKVKKAIELTPRKNCEILVKALKESLDELELLVKVLNDKIGRNDAPGMSNLRNSLGDCHHQMSMLLKDKGGAAVETPEAEAGEGTGEAGATAEEEVVAVHVKKTTLTRADVYQRLAESADLLEKMEPHSPIPYMIKRAVELGSLPFPQLMKALITDAKAVDELNKGLGIKDEAKK